LKDGHHHGGKDRRPWCKLFEVMKEDKVIGVMYIDQMQHCPLSEVHSRIRTPQAKGGRIGGNNPRKSF
jgi:hypothetical protein